jgi:hypothetical protein
LTSTVFDDTGCPHTLEQSAYFASIIQAVYIWCFNSLVFMGSEKYPYKGIIDHLANRGFSTGTNAWTDTDHTAYTVNTAGEQGFLQILPIYVDHILYPTITDAGFITEVCERNCRDARNIETIRSRFTISMERATTQESFTAKCREEKILQQI